MTARGFSVSNEGIESEGRKVGRSEGRKVGSLIKREVREDAKARRGKVFSGGN